MKKKRFLSLMIAAGIVCLSLMSSFHAQDKTKTTETEAAVPKTVKKDGWEIPKIDEKELISRNIINLQGVPVTMKGYKLQKSIDTKLNFYFLTADNTLNTYTEDVEIKSVAAYILNEKPFAYQTLGTPFNIFEDGTRENAGILIRVFYFDEDGDGKFETRYIGNKLPDKIPLWATKSTNVSGNLNKPRN